MPLAVEAWAVDECRGWPQRGVAYASLLLVGCLI